MIGRNLILVVLAVLCSWNVGVAEEASARELQVKVAYLYHFTKFAEWPVATPVFHYCVYQNADFADLLRQAYSNKTIGEASIEVQNINAQTPLDGCQLIYFSQAVSTGFLEKIHKLAILSVGVQEDFPKIGGIIYLFEEDQKMHFYINNTAAVEAGLKISSQLLTLSRKP